MAQAAAARTKINTAFLGGSHRPRHHPHYIGARWYDPTTGTYAAGDPVPASDPTGLRKEAMVGGGCEVHCLGDSSGGTSQNADAQTSSGGGGSGEAWVISSTQSVRSRE